MSLLGKLIDKAKGWIGAQPAAPVKHTDAIVHNRFHQALFDEMLGDAPALGQLVTSLNKKYDYTDDLVRDTFMAFFQGDPILRAQSEMQLGHLANHAVAVNIRQAPDTAQARAFSKHDKYGATMATIAVGEKLRGHLEEQKELAEKAKEAQEAQQALEQANKGLQEAADAAGQAGENADQAMDGYDGEGPLTEAQAQAQAEAQAAADALQQALDQAENAQQQNAAAQQAAEQAGERALKDMRGPVRQAVKEAADQLADEAALASGWGQGESGELQRMDFAERQRMAARLRNHRLAKFIKEFGRWRMMGNVQRAKKVTPAREEVYDVELSDRMPDVLPSEFALLGTDLGRLDFLTRLTEGRLLTKKYRGEEKIGQGAIIACIDTSASMKDTDKHGIPREVWGKGMGLVMLDQARTEKRDFVGIIFSSAGQQKVFRFPKGQGSLDEVLDFVEYAFWGSTNFEKPLDLAVDIIENDFNTEGKAKADVVFLTDDECGVSPAWMKRYQERKRRLNFRTFGIAIGLPEPGSTLTALSDNVRAVSEFADPTVVADIIRAV